MKDIPKPLKMIIFNGPLSFSPNTLNNNIITYALAKKWQEQQRSYNDWYQLIQNVTTITQALAKLDFTGWDKEMIDLAKSMRFFNTWNVDGDGSVFVNFQAKATFDSESNQPLKILQQNEKFPVSSPPGYHKAVISDMDTDSQFKSKLFAFQLIIKQVLSLALQPTSFVNIGPKYYRQYSDQTMGADWWTKGQLKVLSEKQQINFPNNNVLKYFYQVARGTSNQQPKPQNNFQLRMNQFNYSQTSKLSFISGCILQSDVKDHLSISYCRRIPVMGQVQGNGFIYLHQIIRPDSRRGILIDLNSVTYVYRNPTTTNFEFNQISVQIKDCFENTSQGEPVSVKFNLNGLQLSENCGFYYHDNVELKECKAKVKVEITLSKESTVILTLQPKKNQTDPQVEWSQQQEYAFEIDERFKKTEFYYKDDADKQNIEKFQPFVEYKFRVTRFGKPIPEEQTETMYVQLSISLVVGEGGGTPGIDATGVMQYSDAQKVNLMFEKAIQNEEFRKKFGCSVEEIKKNWYLNTFDDMNKLAIDIKSRTYYLDQMGKKSFNWYNSHGVKFVGQFQQAVESINTENVNTENVNRTIVKIDKNGYGTFRVYLNENITRKNNPRSLIRDSLDDKGNSIINSLSVESFISPTIIKKGKLSIIPIIGDSISGLYYETNHQNCRRAADWKNFVGPRMRVMGLLYPAMQQIVDLYNFNEMHLGSMKRAFDIQSQLHSRYMPSTREISSFEHRMMRRWLYQPYYDKFNAATSDYQSIYKRVFPDEQVKWDFASKKLVLRQLIKNAFAFELLTIPLYLNAMYGAPSSTIRKLIRDISHDQMKHLFIDSNLLNAIRDKECEDEKEGPPYLDQKYVPTYPTSPIYAYAANNQEVKQFYNFGIIPYGPELIKKFIAAQFPGETQNLILSTQISVGQHQLNNRDIELIQQAMEKIKQVTEMIQLINKQKSENKSFVTVGQMYAQIIELLWQLNDEQDPKEGKVLFSGNPIYQFTYPQLEHMTEIYSLRTALNQIRLIVEEGEGGRIFSVDNRLKKLSHFLKFIQIYIGCQVDEQKTNKMNNPYKTDNFTIYFKYQRNWIVNDIPKNNWETGNQDEQMREIIKKQENGMTPGADSKYSNNVSPNAFTNMYKKIMLQFHYIFNSRYSRFQLYLQKEKKLSLTEAESLAQFKKFKFRRMENAIGKMKNMTLLARYNVRLQNTPSYEPHLYNGNEGKSVKPDYNITVQFPED